MAGFGFGFEFKFTLERLNLKEQRCFCETVISVRRLDFYDRSMNQAHFPASSSPHTRILWVKNTGV